MEFGKSIQERYEQAVSTAREAFDELSEAVSEAGKKLQMVQNMLKQKPSKA